MKRILLSVLMISAMGLTYGQTLHNVCVSEVIATSNACPPNATGIFTPGTVNINVGDSIEFETYMILISGYNGTHQIRFNGGSPYDVALPISTLITSPKTTVRTPAFQTPGIYSMECANSNHCQIAQLLHSFSCTGYQVVVSGTVGQEKAGHHKKFIATYPNPVTTTLSVDLHGFGDNAATIQIFDVLGKQVFTSSNVKNNRLKVDVTGFEKGLYFVKANAGDVTKSSTVVVK